MKFLVLWSGLCCYTVKCSEILAHIKLLYNERVNKVFTSHFTLEARRVLRGRGMGVGGVTFSACHINGGVIFLNTHFRGGVN